MAAFRRVAKADNREISRALAAKILRGIDCPQGHRIVDAKQSGNFGGALDQFLEAKAAAFKPELGYVLSIRFGEGQACLLESSPISGQLSQRRFRPRLCIADEANSTMAQVKEMLRRAKAGIFTVASDHGHAFEVPGQQVDHGNAFAGDLAKRTFGKSRGIPQNQNPACAME